MMLNKCIIPWFSIDVSTRSRKLWYKQNKFEIGPIRSAIYLWPKTASLLPNSSNKIKENFYGVASDSK